MREVIIKKTLKGFNELTEEEKQEVLDRFRHINIDYDWWDWIIDEFIEKVDKKIGVIIDKSEIEFNLDRGAYFSVSGDVYGRIAELFSDKAKVEIYGSKKLAYYHSEFPYNSWTFSDIDEFDIDVYGYDDEEISDKECEEIKEKVRAKLWELARLLEEYFNILRDEYNYLTSDEAVKDTIIANEYEFDEELNVC